LNISNQSCRDLRGVQILVIDGRACEPESYTIKKCIRLGNQDDIFITLDSLEDQKEFLLLVDGYRNDYGAFQIEFSNKPKGMPITVNGIISLRANMLTDNQLEIFWRVPDTIANLIKKYEVYRRYETEFRSEKVHTINQGFNAFGVPRKDYVVNEILADYGTFYYKIIGVGASE